MQKQMYKVHRPHVASGYLTTVQYEATTDADGCPDWLMHYTPGPKARTEFTAFTRQSGHDRAAATLVATGEADQEDLVATVVTGAPGARFPLHTARSQHGAAEGHGRPGHAARSEAPPSTAAARAASGGSHATPWRPRRRRW